MRIRDIMSTPVVTVPERMTLADVARLMLERNIGGVPVVRADGRMCGIVTESDFSARRRPVPFSLLRLPSLFGHWLQGAVEQTYREARSMTAAEIMSEDVVTVTEDQPVDEAVRRMCDGNVHRLPVVRHGVPVGMVTRQDLLRLMLRNGLAAEMAAAPAHPPAAPTHGPWTLGN
jgi:CBS domain-containing protein